MTARAPVELESWLVLSGWLYFALVALLLAVVVVRKREPSAALAWSLAIVLLPGFGAALFLLTGMNRVSRRLLRKRGHREEFADRFSLPGERDAIEKTFVVAYPDDRFGSLGRMLEQLGETPPLRGNETRLYNDGVDAFEAMATAIRAATHHVHIEYYILRDDELGRRFIDLLVDKCAEGVEVRLLVDGLGTFSGMRLTRRLREAGGRSALFLPVSVLGRASPNLRNHRKIVVCDGHTAFFGGLNVGNEYLGRRGRLGRLGRRGRQRDWYDLHMRVRGPAVLVLQLIFVEDWDYSAGELLADTAYFPQPEECGLDTAQVIAGGPDTVPNPIREAFFGAFTRARRSIHVATPYLALDMALRDALTAAARSGVEVHVVTQSWPPDGYLVYFCSQFYVEQLLEAGVHVHVYAAGMMHAKAVAVDGEWAMIGTANLDNRSMFLNFEQMTLFDGPAATTITRELEDLVARCTELDPRAFSERPAFQRILAAIARLFAPLL